MRGGVVTALLLLVFAASPAAAQNPTCDVGGPYAGNVGDTIAFDGTNPEQVTVTVKWKLPGTSVVHQYVTTAEMSLD